MKTRRRAWWRALCVAGVSGSLLLAGQLISVPSAEAACKGSTGSSWDQALTGTCRFTVLADFKGAAVRDNETGLVWEKSPDGVNTYSWDRDVGSTPAAPHCADSAVGGRKGWRLPSVVELASLVDPNMSTPSLPAGHPFDNVQTAWYWSATTLASTGSTSVTAAWRVYFGTGIVDYAAKTNANYAWCVRGPMQESVY